MDSHQHHFGKKFYLDHQSGYWMSTCKPRIRAHKWVWINYHGVPPKGMHIHHKDGNKSNNSIENLTILSPKDHVNHHLQIHPEYLKKRKESCEKIRHLTKEWHGSKEGRMWHKLHALKGKFGNWEPKEYSCQLCEKKYFTKKRSLCRFCSNSCKSQWRRNEGIDNAERNCIICSTGFTVNRYSKTKTCCKKCKSLSQSKTRQGNEIEKITPISLSSSMAKIVYKKKEGHTRFILNISGVTEEMLGQHPDQASDKL